MPKTFTQDEIKHAESFSIDDLWEMMMDAIFETVCGCLVEPDGWCPCGNHSPMLVLGLI